MTDRERCIRSILDCLPPSQRKHLRPVLEKLPDEVLEAAARALERVPLDPRIIGRIIALITAPYARAKVAIVGPINTGKSTLFNALAGRSLADTSPVPGTTTRVQDETILGFTMLDTPGADEASAPERRGRAFEVARTSDLLVLVLDASRGVTESDRLLRDRLSAPDVPLLLVLNKIDVVKGDREAVVSKAASDLGVTTDEILAVSATRREGLEDLVRAMIASSPELAAAIGRAFPPHRDKIANWTIASAAALGAVIGASPIPFSDIFPLIALQGSLVLSLARLYGHPMTAARAREMVPTFAGGFVWREVFRQLLKFFPGGGWALSGAVAGAATVVVGLAAKAFFKSGEQVPEAEKRAMFGQLKESVKLVLRQAGRDEEALQQQLEQDLSDISIHDAAGRGARWTVGRLLKHDADVNAKDASGRTPLHHAAERGRRATASLLLKRGADVNARDNDGATPLRLAVKHGRCATAVLLRSRGGVE